MKIGLIVAIETDAIFDYYKDVKQLACPQGFKLYCVTKPNADIFILRTGMGEVASASGVQYLAGVCNVDVIVNFGVVGGLTGDMAKHKLCVVDRVVHYRYDCTEFMDLALGQVDGHDSIFLPTTLQLVDKALAVCPQLMRATCCSGDRFVGKQEDKQHLHDAFCGDVCDMESAGIVLTCEANNLPCLLLKAVSDGLSEGARSFYEELHDAAFECLQVADEIMNTL